MLRFLEHISGGKIPFFVPDELAAGTYLPEGLVPDDEGLFEDGLFIDKRKPPKADDFYTL